jgi:cell division protein ZapA
MSSTLSIKVNIAGRTYPLTIDRSEEEAIRKAADAINKNIKDLQSNYAVRDMQDLIAMTSLQFSTDLLKQTKSVEQEQEQLEITELDLQIQTFLKQ